MDEDLTAMDRPPRRRLSKNLNNDKKWPLLVRSLSDSAKYRRRSTNCAEKETKALTLSLSDSRLFTHKKSSLLDLLHDKLNDPETCSCGCDQALEDEEEDYSEDEGCFVITTNVPQQEEVTNKISEGNNNEGPTKPTMQQSPSSPGSKCIYIDSVDSGRSSDTGTHQSWTSSSSKSSTGSKSKTNGVGKSDGHGVQIVPHTFCDYLGSIKRRVSSSSPCISSSSSSSYASMSSCQKNKVRVYVPYSTLIALTNEIRETPVDDLDDDDDDEEGVSTMVDSIVNDVVICDTQVILRINPDEDAETSTKKYHGNNRRMTRRLLTDSEAFKNDQATSGTPSVLPRLPKRKDLCKLLGLNEQDVDLMIVPEVKVAQKVALNHSVTEINKNTAKKKDLAKFLGVEEERIQREDEIASNSASIASESSDARPKRSKDQSPRPKSFLINWGQMVKSSVKGWKFDENQHSDIEMDVPVQLRQIPAKEPERTHRKDLSKFLGLDDSDSEEIVFIRNANPSINDSSLTRTKSSSFDDDDGHEDSDDSVGSLRSFDSFVRRSLRCGASSEFAIQIEEGALQQQSLVEPKRGDIIEPLSSEVKQPHNHHRVNKKDKNEASGTSNLVTLDRKPAIHNPSSRILPRSQKEKQRVAFGPNSRRMISPVRTKKRQQHHNQYREANEMPPIFMREEPLFVYPQKPALFYQHYPLYASYGLLPPGGRINPNNGRVRIPKQQAKRPQMNS